MSIMRCDVHGSWDSDFHEECPRCEEAMTQHTETATPRTDAYRKSVLLAELLKHPIREFEGALEHADELERELAALQARLDAVMLEHCPDEMTPEQVAEWEKHQKAVDECDEADEDEYRPLVDVCYLLQGHIPSMSDSKGNAYTLMSVTMDLPEGFEVVRKAQKENP